MQILSKVERNSKKRTHRRRPVFAETAHGRPRIACNNSDATGYRVAKVALVTTAGLVLPRQKLLMYGSAASARATLTTCQRGLFVGGIGT
jgi:hypothetical protein